MIVLWISEMKLYDIHHSGFSDYCCHFYYYIHNVSVDMSSGEGEVDSVYNIDHFFEYS